MYDVNFNAILVSIDFTFVRYDQLEELLSVDINLSGSLSYSNPEI